ncbi:UDP-3-O-(3-hydroxymyristoyl)glucosamine N-acyltransferase [Pseudohoeflea suaedae]|uniref:UDP-3-O-acylglucosamine N-acyltransferase n=1 Tax=Pseudohoeflea suaedae TaxID=877384 RepID=A0A4R5PLM6_9HYPH|nr:UDP-3-O-(3-hydroxymyristoyl)glucosamine N-acyltransferase [Pseudohoeflea suaedae]TDH36184.1 UDP-3-O-(3-hydroxymyristoyl)glucosamine N-acyltransferase [Pseudohoeflea suaedae]
MAPNNYFSGSAGLSISHLAEACGADLVRPEMGETQIFRIAPLARAAEGEVTFIKSRRSLEQLEKSAASAVFCTEALADKVPTQTAALVVGNPESAFAIAAALLYPEAMNLVRITSESGISPHAVIDPEARLEENVTVEAGAVIGRDVEIGSGSVVLANAVIGPGTRIGRDCTIGANASILHSLIGNRVIIHAGVRLGGDGFGYAAGARGLAKLPQVGRVVIQDDVEIGANTAVDRGAMDDTVIGEGTKIDNLVQIGHNVRIGRHCALAGTIGIAGSATIGDGVMIGGGTGINGHISIGDGAVIAGFTGVHGDVPAGAQWGGIPARPLRGVIRDGLEAIARAKQLETGKKGRTEQ